MLCSSGLKHFEKKTTKVVAIAELPSGWVSFPGMALGGSTYYTQSRSGEHCVSLCSRNEHCQAIDYNTVSGICTLHLDSDVCTSLKPNPKVYHAKKTPCGKPGNSSARHEIVHFCDSFFWHKNKQQHSHRTISYSPFYNNLYYASTCKTFIAFWLFCRCWSQNWTSLPKVSLTLDTTRH